MVRTGSRIVCLSNVYDQQYHQLRGEPVARCLSSPKRRDLFRCLEIASNREVVVMSSPPKALERRSGRWICATETLFSTHRQFFSPNWDGPKLRVPFSWLFYANHVLDHLRDEDIVLIDNYELIYILTALAARLRRRVTFLLDYEDGKHLVCKGVDLLLANLAETLGRPIIHGALLAHPGLRERIPSGIPTEVIPGFVVPTGTRTALPQEDQPVRFLYTGSLDEPRGIDIILAAVQMLPLEGWQLDITGIGPLADKVAQLAKSKTFAGRVNFHGALPPSDFIDLVSQCHVGVNCQRIGEPISSVTFPSKVFSYLSSGLTVLSTKASSVPEICGDACLYLETDTPESLAKALRLIIAKPAVELGKVDTREVRGRYSIEGTSARLARFFDRVTDVL